MVAHREGSLHATVHMWIVRPNEKSGYDVLLQKRSQTKDSNPGSYDISSAGHVDAGDEILESAIRELKEELDIEAKPEELHYIGVHYGAFEAEFYGKMFRDRELSSVYVYTEPVEIEKPQITERRSGKRFAGWITRSAGRKFMTARCRTVFTKMNFGWSGNTLTE